MDNFDRLVTHHAGMLAMADFGKTALCIDSV
jgi:hypothetical protein